MGRDGAAELAKLLSLLVGAEVDGRWGVGEVKQGFVKSRLLYQNDERW